MRQARTFVAVSAVLVIAFILMAAGNPKTTGDSTWPHPSGQQAHTVFNAIATAPIGLDAKGSVYFSIPGNTYSADVKFLKVVGNTAWFAAQVTTVEGTGCCVIGGYVFYKIVDNGEPGIGFDQIWGEDLGASIARLQEAELQGRTHSGDRSRSTARTCRFIS